MVNILEKIRNIILLVFLLSCNPSIQENMVNKLDSYSKNNVSDTFRIGLRDVISISKDWDTMHVFGGPYAGELIARNYGLLSKQGSFQDTEKLFIFTMKGAIIYEKVEKTHTRLEIGRRKFSNKAIFIVRILGDSTYTLNPIVSDSSSATN